MTPTGPAPAPGSAPGPAAGRDPSAHGGWAASRRRAACLGLDVLAVTVFVVIGRHSHHHGLAAAGVVSTLWPFAAGLGTGWLVAASRGWTRAADGWATGIAAWLATVGVGMALRVAAGQGTAVSFTLVALAFLGLALLGWRALARAAGAGRGDLGRGDLAGDLGGDLGRRRRRSPALR